VADKLNVSSDPDPNKWATYVTEKFINAQKEEINCTQLFFCNDLLKKYFST
jgi:hypothetical protein